MENKKKEKRKKRNMKAKSPSNGPLPTPCPPSRPAPLPEFAGPRASEQRRTVTQIEDFVPVVQILDVPVLHVVDQLVDVLKIIDTMLLVVAGDRSAQDQSPGQNPAAHRAPRVAGGGTVGGSADCRISVRVPAAILSSRTLTFQWGVVQQIFKVSSQDRGQQHVVGLTVEVFKVFPQDMLQQRFGQRLFLSATRRSSLFSCCAEHCGGAF